jgi:hypothetical protein
MAGVTPPAGAHPDWCVRFYCTANGGHSGAHRSTPIVVSDPPLGITANLYSAAELPEEAVVEVRGVPVLLPAEVAHHLGRVLTSLGRAGETE